MLRGIITAVAGLFLTSSALASSVYFNDFETNTNGFSAGGTTSEFTTAAGSGSTSKFLGKFAGASSPPVPASTILSLTGLTAGTTYVVSFDLFIGRSWDGNDTSFGPDKWSLTSSTSETLVDTTFASFKLLTGLPTQNYSDSNPIGPGSNDFFTGADVAFSSSDGSKRYSIYYFSHGATNPNLYFTANGTTESLTFTGTNLQSAGDEYWALDNVDVSAAVPLPSAGWGGLGLLGGMCGLKFVRRNAGVQLV